MIVDSGRGDGRPPGCSGNTTHIHPGFWLLPGRETWIAGHMCEAAKFVTHVDAMCRRRIHVALAEYNHADVTMQIDLAGLRTHKSRNVNRQIKIYSQMHYDKKKLYITLNV